MDTPNVEKENPAIVPRDSAGSYDTVTKFQQGGYRKEGERVDVSIFLNVEGVSRIDLVNQKFECQFDMALVWRATDDDHRRYRENPVTYTPSFIPDIVFPNGIVQRQELKEWRGQTFVIFCGGIPDMWGVVHTEENMRCKYLNQCIHIISGEFSEPFELKNFPMDVQDLQITMS